MHEYTNTFKGSEQFKEKRLAYQEAPNQENQEQTPQTSEADAEMADAINNMDLEAGAESATNTRVNRANTDANAMQNNLNAHDARLAELSREQVEQKDAEPGIVESGGKDASDVIQESAELGVEEVEGEGEGPAAETKMAKLEKEIMKAREQLESHEWKLLEANPDAEHEDLLKDAEYKKLFDNLSALQDEQTVLTNENPEQVEGGGALFAVQNALFGRGAPTGAPAAAPSAPNTTPTRRAPRNTQLDTIAGEIFTSEPQSLQDGVNQFRNNLLAGANFAKTPEEKNILNQAVDAAVQKAEQLNFDQNNPETFMRECAKIRQNFLKNNPQLRALANKMQERAVMKENINNVGKILGEIAKMLREFMQAFRGAAGLAPLPTPPGAPSNTPANAPSAPSNAPSQLSAPEQAAMDEIKDSTISNVIADATTERDAAKNKLDGPPAPGLRKKVASQGVREVALKKDVDTASQDLKTDPNNATKKANLRNAEEALRLHRVEMENTEKERQVQEQKLNEAQKELDTIDEVKKKAQEQADSIEKEMKEMTVTLAGTKSPEMSVIHNAVENVTTSLDAKLNIRFDLANYNPQEWKDMAVTAKQFGVDASAFDIEDVAGKKIIKNPDVFLKGLQTLHQHAKQGIEKKTEIVTSLEQNGIRRGQAEKAAKASEEYGIEFEASNGTLKVKSGGGDKVAAAYFDDVKNLPNTHQVKIAMKLHLDNLLSDVRTEGGFNALKTLLARSPGGNWGNEDVVKQLVDLAGKDGMEGFEHMYVDGNGIVKLPNALTYKPKIQQLINDNSTEYVNLHQVIKNHYGVT